MTALRFGKLIVSNDPARLSRVVVLDRRLEVLAHRVGLAKLAPQPAQQAHLRRAAYRLKAQICSLRSVTNPSRS